MADLSTTSKSNLVSALQRARNSVIAARVEGKKIAGRGINTGLTVGTAFGLAQLRKNYGEGSAKRYVVPGTDIDLDLAVGVLAAGAGVAGMADDYSDAVAAVGAGALACAATAHVLLGNG